MFNFFEEIKKGLKKTDNEFNGYNIINMSGRLVYVEGHRGLLALSKELVVFKTKHKNISVVGKDMILEELSENTLKISGEIQKVEEV